MKLTIEENWSNLQNNMEFYIYFACLFICLFVFNKRQNGWTDRDQILCGTSRDPSEVLCMIKFQKFAINTIFLNTAMFTIEIEDGREAP